VPAAFEILDGPPGDLHLEEGELLAWEMQTPEGEIGHNPTRDFDFRPGRDLDVTLYAFILACVWGHSLRRFSPSHSGARAKTRAVSKRPR
jgi:hypothetical protein